MSTDSNEQHILERLTPVFQDIFDNPELHISTETTASDIDQWDSLSNVNLVVTIEKEFGIRFALGEMESLKNVGEMIRLICQKTG